MLGMRAQAIDETGQFDEKAKPEITGTVPHSRMRMSKKDAGIFVELRSK